MKRVLIMVAVSTLFTGCAQVQQSVQRRLTPPIELAKQDCIQMGFTVNTVQYQNCVMTTAHNISNIRAQDSQAAENARMNASRMTEQRTTIIQQPQNYDCRARLGGRVECTGY